MSLERIRKIVEQLGADAPQDIVDKLHAAEAESYDQRHGVHKEALPQPLSKEAMDLLLTNPDIYDDMVQKGLLP
jgi:hypothetical protein